jgi:hypothetical protein
MIVIGQWICCEINGNNQLWPTCWIGHEKHNPKKKKSTQIQSRKLEFSCAKPNQNSWKLRVIWRKFVTIKENENQKLYHTQVPTGQSQFHTQIVIVLNQTKLIQNQHTTRKPSEKNGTGNNHGDELNPKLEVEPQD